MKINIITYDKYFGHQLRVEDSLNISEVEGELREKNVNVETFNIKDFLKRPIVSTEYYWITSHQNPDIKKYLNDIVISKFMKNPDRLLPSL
ncbi:hypothetical protein, partial [Photobacterium halotolerans]|uniref:hypothetical protein n=1 Tax=Photobacterium halotolerans TaxID=265726 RepID=UPI001F1DCD32